MGGTLPWGMCGGLVRSLVMGEVPNGQEAHHVGEEAKEDMPSGRGAHKMDWEVVTM